MESFEVAAKFDDRPGYRIVDYAEVAMPFFRIFSTALIQGAISFSPIEEFVLRLLETGLTDVSEISGFLGLNKQVVNAALITLISNSLVKEDPDGAVMLTGLGRQEIANQKPLRPTTETIPFDVDGLTRKPFWQIGHFHKPREIKDLGLVEIDAVPRRAPAIDEIQIEDVDRAFQMATGRATDKRVLRLREIVKVRRHFYDAVALVYRGQTTDDTQVAFAVDGRLSDAHELAFAKADGLARSGIEASMRASRPNGTRVRIEGVDIAPIVATVAESPTPTTRDTDDTAGRISIGEDDNIMKATYGEPSLPVGLENVELIRNIPVYEHAPLLNSALSEATRRLLIISPWISGAVVDSAFIRKVQKLLERGVSLTIGYGIEKDGGSEFSGGPNWSERELQKLANRYGNFAFSKLGDTHAKILIKDSDHYVVTSFNWLSFRGDPKRTFREEWGTLVSIPEKVDDFYAKINGRFPR